MPKRLVRILIILAAITICAWLVSQFGNPDRVGSTSAVPTSSSTAATSAPVQPATRHRMHVTHLGLRLSEATATQDPQKHAGLFAGHIVSSRGEAIAGAELSLAYEGAVFSALSKQDGAFQFEPQRPGTYTLELVTAKGYHPFSPTFGQSPVTWVARSEENIQGIRIVLVPEVTYKGLVQSPEGKPLEAALVHILDAPSTANPIVTDAKGAFSFTAPDGALLEATHVDYSPARKRVDLSAQVSHQVVIRLRNKSDDHRADQTIAGKVVNAQGEGVFGAFVSATYRAENPAALGESLHDGADTSTDEHGAFVLEELDRGRYDVMARGEGNTVVRVTEVPSGTQDLVLKIETGGRISGLVRDEASSQPVVAFSIIVVLHRGPLSQVVFTTASFFDAKGEYEVSGLLPGTYSVAAAAHGYAHSSEVQVTISSPPGDPSTADFALNRGGRLSGFVVEEGSQQPISGANISVEGILETGIEGVPVLTETVTDVEGHFDLQGLAAGVRSISVLAEGHHGRILSGLKISKGGDIGPITVELSPVAEGEEPKIELTGIGAVLSAKNDALIIGQLLKGGGAEEAGLSPGDTIVAVDGIPVVQVGFEMAIQSIRGPEGSTVTLSVKKGGQGTAVDVTVLRKRVRT